MNQIADQLIINVDTGEYVNDLSVELPCSIMRRGIYVGLIGTEVRYFAYKLAQIPTDEAVTRLYLESFTPADASLENRYEPTVLNLVNDYEPGVKLHDSATVPGTPVVIPAEHLAQMNDENNLWLEDLS